jgi:hypothetical protein
MTNNPQSVPPSAYSLLEESLRLQWYFGREIILCWTYNRTGLVFLSVPYYLIGALIAEETTNADFGNEISIREILRGSRYTSEASLAKIKQIDGLRENTVIFPEPSSPEQINTDEIDELIRRYSISYVENHAVALFDIVGFSTHSPFDQVTLLSSLSYSINSAYNKMKEQDINVNFARTTTGDGFYIWTKELSIKNNINLYSLVQIILADNAIARTKSYGYTAPILKTAFHIGNYYEFHQPEELQQTPYSYIVGDVTIELARIIENAMPGQILIGDFKCVLPAPQNPDQYILVDTINFIDILKEKVNELRGMTISDKEIESIACYLTGKRIDDNEFTISRYEIRDKHDLIRTAYNAKVNIYRKGQPPIFLGIQESEVFITPKMRRL